MKKLIPILLIFLFCGFVYGQTPKLTTVTTSDYFQTTKGGVSKMASSDVVKTWGKTWAATKHATLIEFRLTQTDSTDFAKSTVYTEFSDTLSYTLARSGIGVYTMTCTNGTPFTANKTKVSYSQNQGTGKFYFSAAVTSTSVLTLYQYLQTTDAASDAGFTSEGTFLLIEVFP